MLLDPDCGSGESGAAVVKTCITIKRMHRCVNFCHHCTNWKSYGDGGVATREDPTSWNHAVTSLHVGGTRPIVTSFFVLMRMSMCPVRSCATK